MSARLTLPGAPVPPKPKESEVRKAVRDYLRIRGWLVMYNLQALGCYPGMPDLVAVRRGRTIWIELKRPGGKQRPNQRKFQAALEAAGGEYLLVTDVEDVMRWEASR